MSDLRIETLEELCDALEQAATAADVRHIATAWSRRTDRTHQSWGDELIYDAHRAFDRD
jgi:hypothetical protein